MLTQFTDVSSPKTILTATSVSAADNVTALVFVLTYPTVVPAATPAPLTVIPWITPLTDPSFASVIV